MIHPALTIQLKHGYSTSVKVHQTLAKTSIGVSRLVLYLTIGLHAYNNKQHETIDCDH